MKTVIALLAALSILAIGGAAGKANPAESVPAPDFSLKDLQGKDLMLSTYKGKVLFLNFWATWCPPCRAEIPDFIEAYGKYKDKGLEILGISVDNMAAQKLSAWVTSVKINYPVALATPKVVRDFQPGEYIPTTIVIDKKGIIRHKHVGSMDQETLGRLFKDLSEEN